MKKKGVLLIILFISAVVHATKIASLPGVYKPLRFTIDDNFLYIPDQNGLSVYSMKNFTFIQKIGSKGEGPGEFKRTPNAIILPDEIVLFSWMKFSRFKKDGSLLMEKRVFPLSLNYIYPLGKHYVFENSLLNEEGCWVNEINIVDQDLKKIKSLYSNTRKRETSLGKSVVRIKSPTASLQCNANNIFLADGIKGFVIEVFDYNGESVRVIEKDLPKIKIPESFKKKSVEDLLKKYSPGQREKIAKTITFDFPDYFPAVQDFLVVGDHLYVKTYETGDSREAYIILDTKGNILKKIFLPETHFRSWTVYNNKFYFLKDNEEEEEWELHCIDLKTGDGV